MFNANCVRCVKARQGGYDGCVMHNTARRRYGVPSVVVVEHTTYQRDPFEFAPPAVGLDDDGDPVLNLGGGIGVDMRDGSLEVEVAPGFYMDTDSGGGGFDSSDW
jgi:hypothetical protein